MLNTKKALEVIKGKFQSDWSKIEFNYEIQGDCLEIKANVSLKNNDDDIRIVIYVFESGNIAFRAIFDLFGILPDQVYKWLNDFNSKEVFFKIFIRDDGYLEIDHCSVAYSEENLGEYFDEAIGRFAGLADNETLQKLTAFTQEDK